MHIEPPTPADKAAIEALLDDAFGTDRHQRAAYRLRCGQYPVPELTAVVRDQAHISATISFWPLSLVAADATLPALLLGPVAVAKAWRNAGLGNRLIRDHLEKAQQLGHGLIILIGDLAYYQRFGFTNMCTGKWHMPGQQDQARILARRLDPGLALPTVAEIRPAKSCLPS